MAAWLADAPVKTVVSSTCDCANVSGIIIIIIIYIIIIIIIIIIIMIIIFYLFI